MYQCVVSKKFKTKKWIRKFEEKFGNLEKNCENSLKIQQKWYW